MLPNLQREKILRRKHGGLIAGIDEAGRGPLAGPVVAGAVILPPGFSHDVLNDSKKLTPRQRDMLYDELTSDSKVSWACGVCQADEVDALNILRATHLAMARAVEQLEPMCVAAVVDGLPVKGLPVPHEAVVKGDQICLSIAAASIIAKVSRDRMMIEHAKSYPEYGFDKHKGYGTQMHLAALGTHGPCPIHRRSFQPVAQCRHDSSELAPGN